MRNNNRVKSFYRAFQQRPNVILPLALRQGHLLLKLVNVVFQQVKLRGKTVRFS